MLKKSLLKNILLLLFLVLPCFSFASNVFGTWGLYENNLWNRAFENGQSLDVQMHTIKVSNSKKLAGEKLEITFDDQSVIPFENVIRKVVTPEGEMEQSIQVEKTAETLSANRKFQILVTNKYLNGLQSSERIEANLYAFENGETFAQIKRTKYHMMNPPLESLDFYYRSVFYYVKISDI